MKLIAKVLFLISIPLLFTGCQEQETASKKLLSVDFAKGEVLKYNIVSERDVVLKLSSDKPSKNQESKEKLDMVIAYELQDIDLYGNATVKATCESVSVDRKSFSKRKSGSDPMESIEGKSWEFKVNSLGQIQDYSGMEAFIKEVGTKSIAEQGKRRIKGEDMIWDFVATQWYMWEPVASIEKPLEGIAAGQSWQSYLSIPFARMLPAERLVTYTIKEKDPKAENDYVTIASKYELAPQIKDDEGNIKAFLKHIPHPYEGSYQMRGMFGFLRGYRVVNLEGEGETLYDAESGVLVSDKQDYDAEVVAAFLFPLGDSVPELTIKQSITIKLLEDKEETQE